MRDHEVLALIKRIRVIADEAMEARGHTPVDVRVSLKDGRELFGRMDIAPGFPGNPLSPEEHEQRFRDCLDFAKKPIGRDALVYRGPRTR